MQNKETPLPPFSCTFSPELPKLLHDLNCSLAVTTYQAGKLLFISPAEKNTFTMLPRTFDKPMGMDLKDDRLVLATRDEIIVFENSKDLAVHYPNKKDTYDSLFVPRITYHTGQVDMHDIAFTDEGIWAVNTSFSCLCQINGNYNFIPRWQPPFIDKLVSEDRCHLNGFVLKNGKPKYVSMLGTSNSYQGWRENIIAGGLLMDVETNEIILDRLPMPHSPTYNYDVLYMLLSASGEVIKVDLHRKNYEVIYKFDGLCRGLDIIGDYMFIGMSKLRKNSTTFAKLSFSDNASLPGIKVIHLPTKTLVGELNFQSSVEEIYEVKIIPDSVRPNILNTINPVYKQSLSIPGSTFWAKPE